MYYHSVSVSKMKPTCSNNASAHRWSKYPTYENLSNLMGLNLEGDSKFYDELNDSLL